MENGSLIPSNEIPKIVAAVGGDGYIKQGLVVDNKAPLSTNTGRFSLVYF